jgi:hypothetical protein
MRDMGGVWMCDKRGQYALGSGRVNLIEGVGRQ